MMMKQAENLVNRTGRPQQQQRPSGPREALQGPCSGRALGMSCFPGDTVYNRLDFSKLLGRQVEWDSSHLSNPMPVNFVLRVGKFYAGFFYIVVKGMLFLKDGLFELTVKVCI